MTIVENAKQIINAVLMYLYLRYYQYKLATDTRFMIKEALNNRADLRD